MARADSDARDARIMVAGAAGAARGDSSASSAGAHASESATVSEIGGSSGRGPARSRGWWQSVRESVWAPIAAKSLGIFAGMLALSGIGAWSTLHGSGLPLALASASPAAASASAAAAPASSVSSAPSAAPPADSPPATSTPSGGILADGRVVLNLASVDELTKLPRVGPKRAQNILELRKKLGKFRQATDLLRVKGIGRKTLQLMLPRLVVDAPSPALPAAAASHP
jgi:competence protein ComEA